jgi:hypothetical protein
MIQRRRHHAHILPCDADEGVMGIAYGARIPQRPPALLTLEEPRRGELLAARITRWRRLNTRTVRRLRAAAPRLGDGARPRQRGGRPTRPATVRPCCADRRTPAGRSWDVLRHGRPRLWRCGRVGSLAPGRCGAMGAGGGGDSHSLHGSSPRSKRPETKLKTGRRRPR